MTVDLNSPLSGPRGRRFLFGFALLDQTPDSPSATLWGLSFSAAPRLETARGQGGVLLGPGANEPLPDPSVEDVSAALNDVPLAVVSNWSVIDSLVAAVDSARYWQEPDGTDELLTMPGMRQALERVGEHLAHSPAVSWWGDIADEQRRVRFADPSDAGVSRPPAFEALQLWQTDVIEGEERAFRERPADPTARWSGNWWSKPAWSLTTSTRELPALGPLGLWLVEDSFGWQDASVETLEIAAEMRIFEIRSAKAWADLCRSYPLDVTASRRHDWYRATGRNGQWLIPDWSLVAADFDAVHLQIGTYLSSVGIPIPVEENACSMIAGWDPDETYWLTDVPVRPGSQSQWHRDEDSARWNRLRKR